jgi:hypothetical protein
MKRIVFRMSGAFLLDRLGAPGLWLFGLRNPGTATNLADVSSDHNC